MDIKAKINEIVKKIKSDPDLLKSFSSDPTGAVKKVAGVDLPEDQLNKIIEGVKAKLSGGFLNKIKSLFKKK